MIRDRTSSGRETRTSNPTVTMRTKARSAAALGYSLIVIALCTHLLFTSQVAQAQTETVLYSFQGSPGDGAYPDAGLVFDKQGNLYGTTLWGGTDVYGTVFKLAPDGTETVLHNFGQRPDGRNPVAPLVLDRHGNVYGTTGAGGTYGKGTVFKLSTDGSETVLHNFQGAPVDGGSPYGNLVLDKQGNLYGIAAGGTHAAGMIFKLAPDGTETALWNFASYSKNGSGPSGNLLLDKQGNLYGTTNGGGAYHQGTVFKLTPAGTETVLYSFGSQPGDAVNPSGAWVFDKQGNLYGTAAVAVGPFYHGVVFKLTPEGTETVFYVFGSQPGDGSFPLNLVLDKEGNLYGATEDGGTTNWGTVFRLTPAGSETVLYSFGSQPGDGLRPEAGVVIDKSGNLYGTTNWGGAYVYGTVFKVIP